MNIVNTCGIDLKARSDSVSALCFHPTENKIFIAAGAEIFGKLSPTNWFIHRTAQVMFYYCDNSTYFTFSV